MENIWALSWQGVKTPCLLLICHQVPKSKTLFCHIEMHTEYYHLYDGCMLCIPNGILMDNNNVLPLFFSILHYGPLFCLIFTNNLCINLNVTLQIQFCYLLKS